MSSHLFATDTTISQRELQVNASNTLFLVCDSLLERSNSLNGIDFDQSEKNVNQKNRCNFLIFIGLMELPLVDKSLFLFTFAKSLHTDSFPDRITIIAESFLGFISKQLFIEIILITTFFHYFETNVSKQFEINERMVCQENASFA